MEKILWRAIRVSLVVGTLLFLINHYQLFLGAEMKEHELLQIALTYLVPFGVSFYSARCEALDNVENE